MNRLFTDTQIQELTQQYDKLRLQGLSKNKCVETIAKEKYCHPYTVGRLVKAWERA